MFIFCICISWSGTTAGKCCYGTGIWNPSCSRSPTPYWWSWRRCLHWEGPPLPAWCSTRPPPPAAAWTRALVDQIRVGRAWTPSELKWAGDSHDWGPGDVRTQLSASQHCTDQSAEAQHWLWPSPAPSLRHFSALIRSQVLSPTNVVILKLSAPPLSQVVKYLTFASHLTYLFTWMQICSKNYYI